MYTYRFRRAVERRYAHAVLQQSSARTHASHDALRCAEKGAVRLFAGLGARTGAVTPLASRLFAEVGGLLGLGSSDCRGDGKQHGELADHLRPRPCRRFSRGGSLQETKGTARTFVHSFRCRCSFQNTSSILVCFFLQAAMGPRSSLCLGAGSIVNQRVHTIMDPRIWTLCQAGMGMTLSL